ncbi:MAG: hypothetical protein CMP25_01550 [Rickettsiales bacterium]|nr:hypothetical protein [Rickettsiales bacterium]
MNTRNNFQMLSKKDLDKNDFFVLISTLKKIVGIVPSSVTSLENLIGIEEQKKILYENTISFIKNNDSCNILLWGSKGMGKSSLVISNHKHLLRTYKNIKLIEILCNDLIYLPEIIYNLRKYQQKFIIFIDDVNLDVNSYEFKTLKVLIQGSILSNSKNIRFYVTSNIRNIINPDSNDNFNEVQINDQRNNAIALYDRFGLILSFYRASKEEYINLVHLYARINKIKIDKDTEKQAIQWSIFKGDYSGRTAIQFITNLKSKIL